MGARKAWLVRIIGLLMTIVPAMVSATAAAEEPCAFDRKHAWLLQEDPDFALRIAAQDERARARRTARVPLAGEEEIYTIPVVVHVLHLGEAVGTGSNISDAQIISGIAALNKDFRNQVGSGGYAGTGEVGMVPAVDTKIQFSLALRDPADQPSTGILRHDARGITNYAASGIVDENPVGGNEREVKAFSQWPVDHAYNIWIVSKINGQDPWGAGTQGYAYFPGADPAIDGAVILFNAFGTEGNIKLDSKSRTVTHELGHGFDLYHTFEGASCIEVHGERLDPNHNHATDLAECSYDGDLICDTPPHTNTDISCDLIDCAAAPDPEPVENFMNYADDRCRDMFTPEQKVRMRAVLAPGGLRQALAASNACEPVSLPVADFLAPSPTCTGDVQFQDLSSNGPTSWNWAFDSGDPATSNLEHPLISYDTPGEYDVSLTATNSVGTGDTETRAGYLRVYAPPPLDAACQVNTLDPDNNGGMGIFNVSFNTISSDSGGAASTEDNGYQDFSCTRTTDLIPGSTHGIAVTTGGYHSGSGNPEDVRAYIDFNNDGLFAEDNERIFTSDDTLTHHAGSVTLPQTVVTGSLLRLRVVSDFYDQIPPGLQACTDQEFGQAEDYGVVFAAQQAPVIDFATETRTMCVGSEVRFRDRSINGTSSWAWDFAGGTPAGSTDNDPLITYATAGRFGVSLAASNAIGDGDPLTKNNFISVYNPAPPVCQPITRRLDLDFGTGIRQVTMASLQSSSDGALDDATTYGSSGYVDFSCSRTTELDPGTMYQISVTVGSGNDEFVHIWIDYNNNGVFTDPGEMVYQSPAAATGEHGITIATPPDPLVNTLLRLRVTSDVNTLAGPCSEPYLGQVEDYGIVFRLPGDVNDDSSLDLRDIIVALQTVAGLVPVELPYAGADVDGDGRIGLADIVHVLQHLAGLR